MIVISLQQQLSSKTSARGTIKMLHICTLTSCATNGTECVPFCALKLLAAQKCIEHYVQNATLETCAQGLVELQRMQQREAASASRQVPPDDSDDESDAKVDKQRAKDDWKDANPTGWGNSKLRPTA